jgi:hypothetical protein
MPQLLKISLARGGAPVGELDGAPALVEAELNGTWYRREPRLTTPTDGAATGGGASFGNLILDEHWLSISGGRPLRLVPGEYTVRVRLSLRPESRRTGLAISNSVRIRILAETWRAPSVTP